MPTTEFYHVQVSLCTTIKQVRELIGKCDFNWYYGDCYSNSRQHNKLKLEHRLCYQWDKAWEEEMERYQHYEYDAWQEMFEFRDDFSDLTDNEVVIRAYDGGRRIEKFGGYNLADFDDEEFLDGDDVGIDWYRELFLVIKRADEVYSSKSIEEELTYQVLWQRGEWEQRRREDRKAA